MHSYGIVHFFSPPVSLFQLQQADENVWAPGASARTGDSAKKRLYRSVSYGRKTQCEIKWGITCFELLLGSHSKQNMSPMDFQYLASYQLWQRDWLRSSACCLSSDLHPTCFFLLGYKQLTQNRKCKPWSLPSSDPRCPQEWRMLCSLFQFRF